MESEDNKTPTWEVPSGRSLGKLTAEICGSLSASTGPGWITDATLFTLAAKQYDKTPNV